MASGSPGITVTARLLVEAQAEAQETFDHRGSLFVNRARRGVDLEAMSKQRKNGQGPGFQEDATEQMLPDAELTGGRPPEMVTWLLWPRAVDDRVQRPGARANARPNLRILDPCPQAAGSEGRADAKTQVRVGGPQMAFGVENASKIGTYEITSKRHGERRPE